MTIVRTALLVLLSLLAVDPAVATAVHRHAGRRHGPVDWTRTVAATPDGGFRIGNPQAKVAVIEFLSYTCPHCGAFAAEGYPALRDKYVRAGTVSLEVRSALRDRADLIAATIAHCAGPAHFFDMTEAIFAAQSDWESKAIEYDSGHPADFKGPGAAAAMAALANGAGLDVIARQHGIASARLTACFADPAIQATLARTTTDAWGTRQINGTPAFVINGNVAADAHGWPALEPLLQAAING